MAVKERIQTTGPKKILALDNGGIRGMIAVEVLGAIENLLREKLILSRKNISGDNKALS
jgi:patatin-like phospholipase/acyl hydrolase